MHLLRPNEFKYFYYNGSLELPNKFNCIKTCLTLNLLMLLFSGNKMAINEALILEILLPNTNQRSKIYTGLLNSLYTTYKISRSLKS